MNNQRRAVLARWWRSQQTGPEERASRKGQRSASRSDLPSNLGNSEARRRPLSCPATTILCAALVMPPARHGLSSLVSPARLYWHSLRRNCRSFHLRAGLLEDLRARGLVADITRYVESYSLARASDCIRPAQLESEVQKQPQTVYLGVDPTARSLHVGHLVPFFCLLHFQLRGHHIVPLVREMAT